MRSFKDKSRLRNIKTFKACKEKMPVNETVKQIFYFLVLIHQWWIKPVWLWNGNTLPASFGVIEWKPNEKEKVRTCIGIGNPDDSHMTKRCRTATSLLHPIKLVLFTCTVNVLNHIFLDNLGHTSRVNTSLVQSQITVQGLLRLCAWAKITKLLNGSQ